jgi:HEAT repeat protein
MEALMSKEDELRFYAAWALGELRAREALDALTKRLADRNDFVSISAAEGLGKIGDERAAGALARALDAHDKPHMKTSYLSALAAIGGDVARKRLEAFRNSDNRALHVCALGGLVKLAGKNAEPLLKAALNDEDKRVRAWAKRRLLKPDDESYLKRMLATARNTEADFADRRNAVTTLGEQRYKPAIEDLATLLENQQTYLLGRRNKDTISAHAALALYRLGDPRGVEYLKASVLQNAKAKSVVAGTAAKALASVGKKTAIPILIDAIQVRKQRALGAIVESLYLVTGEDPGAEVDITGWKRVFRERDAWKEWWDKNKGEYAE